MEALPDYGAIFAPDLTDEERRRMEAAAGGATPAGTTETPTAALPGTGTANAAKDPNTPIVEPGSQTSFGQSDAGVLADKQQQQLDAAAQQNALLQQQIAAQAASYQQSQDAILKAQQQATTALKDGFLALTDLQKKAMVDADQLRKNTGQAERKPNYSVSLKANAAKNAGGVSSTALTGATGIAPGTLPLGKTALLGS